MSKGQEIRYVSGRAAEVVARQGSAWSFGETGTTPGEGGGSHARLRRSHGARVAFGPLRGLDQAWEVGGGDDGEQRRNADPAEQKSLAAVSLCGPGQRRAVRVPHGCLAGRLRSGVVGGAAGTGERPALSQGSDAPRALNNVRRHGRGEPRQFARASVGRGST
jgi:hypothetical protein